MTRNPTNQPARHTPHRRQFLAASGAALLGAVAGAPSGWAQTQVNSTLHLPPTPQDFGAKADGLSDDSRAITNWLEHLITRSLSGYVPAGDYMMRQAVRTKLTQTARFAITGAGSQVSRFLVHPTNADGGFDIDAFNSRSHQLTLEGFSIIALGVSGIGFRFNLPEGGSQHQRSLVMDDVWCRGANKTSDHFRYAFDFSGCWRPRIQNSGWDGPFIKVGDEDTSARFGCETAFNLDGCYALSIEDSHAWGCRNGITSRVFVGRIASVAPAGAGRVRMSLENGPMPFSENVRLRIRGTNSYDGIYRIHRLNEREFEIEAPFAGSETGRCSLQLGAEGVTIKDNIINGVQTGILVERPNGREPTCWISGNHINYRNNGIVLDGVKILQMDQNNTYNTDKDRTFPGVATDIALRNVSEYIIGAHVFHFDGNPARIGIHVESETNGEGDNGLIHHCIFSGQFQTAVHLTRNASNVRVGPNLYPGKIKQRVRDDNGTNVVI